MGVIATWTADDRPLGCNGFYGNSGTTRHSRRKEPSCQACRDSAAHKRWMERQAKRQGSLQQKSARLEPLIFGCNGRWGRSGNSRHRRRGEAVCWKCSASDAQFRRMKRNFTPKPCGTSAAVTRHRKRKEPLDSLCLKREAADKRQQRTRRKLKAMKGIK